jgi:hypothetical protein
MEALDFAGWWNRLYAMLDEGSSQSLKECGCVCRGSDVHLSAADIGGSLENTVDRGAIQSPAGL